MSNQTQKAISTALGVKFNCFVISYHDKEGRKVSCLECSKCHSKVPIAKCQCTTDCSVQDYLNMDLAKRSECKYESVCIKCVDPRFIAFSFTDISLAFPQSPLPGQSFDHLPLLECPGYDTSEHKSHECTCYMPIGML